MVPVIAKSSHPLRLLRGKKKGLHVQCQHIKIHFLKLMFKGFHKLCFVKADHLLDIVKIDRSQAHQKRSIIDVSAHLPLTVKDCQQLLGQKDLHRRCQNTTVNPKSVQKHIVRLINSSLYFAVDTNENLLTRLYETPS